MGDDIRNPVMKLQNLFKNTETTCYKDTGKSHHCGWGETGKVSRRKDSGVTCKGMSVITRKPKPSEADVSVRQT